MAKARYFKLHDHIGIEPAYVTDLATGEPVENPKVGELQPLVHEVLTITRPVMQGDEVVGLTETLELKPIPGTRILKITDLVVAGVVAELGKYEEIEPPTKDDLKEAREDTESARERAAAGGKEE